MFKLFNKSDRPRITDRIFAHTRNKWPYCQKILTENSKTIFIGWFDETIEELEKYFTQSQIQATVLKARTISPSQIEDSTTIFIEHNPMKKKEQQFLAQSGIKEAVFLTALDEPILKYFGGEKLINIMEKLGMKEDESIEHKLIGQSIANAQEKIESKVSFEQAARSAAEWMERNYK